MPTPDAMPEETGPRKIPAAAGWKSQVAAAYLKVPKTIQELAWRVAVAGFALASTLTGSMVWKNPGIIWGPPVEQQSIVQRLAAYDEDKKAVYALMERFYYQHRPAGLMMVSWEELDELSGIWVRPADKFPGKSGSHGLTPDMRILSGPFVFGECASTDSLALPGKVMVACPIVSSYDVWGYVAAVVEPSEVARMEVLVGHLAHRVTGLIY